MIDRETLDKVQQSVSIRCEGCRWKFRCPIEQMQRVWCHSCEDRVAEKTAQAR